jgi:hypothetical protein
MKHATAESFIRARYKDEDLAQEARIGAWRASLSHPGVGIQICGARQAVASALVHQRAKKRTAVLCEFDDDRHPTRFVDVVERAQEIRQRLTEQERTQREAFLSYRRECAKRHRAKVRACKS